MSDPKRISFPYAEDTPQPDPLAPNDDAEPRIYPDVPMFYPGRREYCSGCSSHSDYLYAQSRRHPDASMRPDFARRYAAFRARPPVRGEASCEECKAKEQTATRERKEGVK